jgi:hypothetical protein
MLSKKLFLVIVTLGIFNSFIFGQQLKDKSVSITCDVFPKLLMPENIKTYAIRILGEPINKEMQERYINKFFIINGLTRVDRKENPDIIVNFKVGDCIVKNKRLDQKSEDNSNGGAPVKSFRYVYSFTWPLEIQYVLTKQKETLYNKIVFKEEMHEEATDPYPDSNTLNTVVMKSNGENTCISETAKKLAEEFNNITSFSTRYEVVYLYTAKGKKLNYDDLDLALKNCKEGLRKDVKTETDPESKTNIQAAIDSWNKIIKEVDTLNTTARINKSIYYGINFNLAVAYFVIKDFENCYKCLNIAKKYRDKSFSENIKTLSDVISSFESGYYLNNPEVRITEVFIGKWKLASKISDEKFDLNGDGKSSFDILSETEPCKRDQIFEFGPEKSLVVHYGSQTNNCTVNDSKLFWVVSKNKTNGHRFLKWDTTSDLEADVATVMEIKFVSHQKVVVTGELHVGGDSSSECTYTFEKIAD